MTFNVEDDLLNFESYAAVYVTKKKSSPLEYATKYVHTYSEVNSGISRELGIGFEKGNITGLLTFGFDLSTNEKSWQLYEDNVLSW